MGASWDVVIRKLADDASYREPFAEAYAGGVTRENIKDAIAIYERSLVSSGARFDRYLSGDHGALSSQEVEGYELFKKIGCVSCHQGRNVGGNMFEKIGIMDDYFAARGGPSPKPIWAASTSPTTRTTSSRFAFRAFVSRRAPRRISTTAASRRSTWPSSPWVAISSEKSSTCTMSQPSSPFIESLAGTVEDP